MAEQRDHCGEGSSVGEYCHPFCIVCGSFNESGLGLKFEQQSDGGVVATFPCDVHYQGYPDRLHGGVIAMLLDAAMTHCLFARRIRAVTARLDIRYRHAVDVNAEALVRAWLEDERPPLYTLRAEVIQGKEVRAAATAKFFGDSVTEDESE